MCVPWAAANPMLSLVPHSQTVDVGDTVVVDVTVSGLGNFAASAIGTFDIELGFDDSIIGFDAGGSSLGDPILGDLVDLSGFANFLGPPFAGIDDLGGGTVELFELSFDDEADLIAAQPSGFVLGTLSFTALSAGTTDLSFPFALLGDEFGIGLDVDLAPGSITVVPAPAAALLGLLGLAIVGTIRRRLNGP